MTTEQGGWSSLDVAAWRNHAQSVESQRDEARGEVKRIRRDVRAVLREWQDYPASYPRAAFIKDVRDALR